jgi:hypothetical protein
VFVREVESDSVLGWDVGVDAVDWVEELCVWESPLLDERNERT